MTGLEFTIQEHILFCLLLRTEGKPRMIRDRIYRLQRFANPLD